MYERILVPTDGSELASAAGEAALALARRFDAELHAISVVEATVLPHRFDDVTDELVRRGKEAVTAIDDEATAAGVNVTTAVIEDAEPVHRAIIDYADDHDIDLVVMGTHGFTGIDRVVLGSVTEQTLRNSPVPVMTVHGDTVVFPAFDSVLVPFDGSDCAQAAVDHAIDLAAATDATLQFVHVVDHSVVAIEVDAGMVLDALRQAGERALESTVEAAERAGVETGETAVLVGSPGNKITEYASERDVDCIVMGTHGRTGMGRVFLGSVAERVIRKTDVPVIATKVSENAE